MLTADVCVSFFLITYFAVTSRLNYVVFFFGYFNLIKSFYKNKLFLKSFEKR